MQLRLLGLSAAGAGHEGEVLSCAFTPDSQFVLTSGWDGMLKLWDVRLGTAVSGLAADQRPLSACSVSPTDGSWFAANMDGLLGQWEAHSQQRLAWFLAHTRPVSALRFSPDGRQLVSASWDGQLLLWSPEQLGHSGLLGQHADIIAGCAFVPDGRRLVSWSYDGTICWWDVRQQVRLRCLSGHTERITAGDVSPDARWLATGARDGQVKLWDLETGNELLSLSHGQGIRACLFLLDALSLLVVEADGRLTLHTLPEGTVQAELTLGLPVQCAARAPSGELVVLGSSEGRVAFLCLPGFDQRPLVAAARRWFGERPGLWRRLLGRRKLQPYYRCTCPVCRHAFDLSEPQSRSTCPACQRALRICLILEAPVPLAAGRT